ncbi:MAG: radical SAM protein [bacterium]|nr:radical SAM protein [bacterium]MCP5070015.1 radical SAM protein [bacterium]
MSDRDSVFAEPSQAEPVAPGDYGYVKPEHAEFPPILVIAVTNVCNMACIHCAHPIIKKDSGYRGTFMKPEVHRAIVEQTRDFKDKLWMFRYAADGESMLHPNFLDFVEETKASGIGPVDLTTNGMTLDDESIHRLLRAPIDVIDISLDAHSRESYEKVRIRGNFDTVVANLERLIELRDQLNSPTKIMTSIIRQKEALTEVQAFEEFWGQRVDEVIVRGLNSDLGIVDVSETYFDDDLERWPCHQFWKRVTVNHDGDVRFCVEDWRNTELIGNVLETTIQEIWHSPIYEQLRELHASGRWNDIRMCSKCQDWQHMRWDHGFEKAINRVMGVE